MVIGMDGINQKVAAALEAARQDADLSIRALERETGIPRVTLMRRLKGTSSFLLDEFLLICWSLNIDPKSIISKLTVKDAA